MLSESVFDAFTRSYDARRETDMSITEYLDLCKKEPLAYANATERLLAAIGEPQMVDTARDTRLGRIFMNRTIRIYPAFAGFHGMEETIERIVSFFRHAAQEKRSEKSRLFPPPLVPSPSVAACVVASSCSSTGKIAEGEELSEEQCPSLARDWLWN